MSVRNYEEYRRQVLDSLGEDYTVEDLRNFERWRLKVLEGLGGGGKVAQAIVVTNSASGSIASFDDGGDGFPLKSLVVNIEPKQSGSGDPSPTNVRPISGWSGANVNRTGVNLLDWTKGTSDKTITLGGAEQAANNISHSDFIRVLPSTQYYANFSGSANIWGIIYFDENKQPLNSGDMAGAVNPKVITTPNNCYYLIINVATSQLGTSSLNYPSTDTSYHPYQGESKSIPFKDKNGNPITVYGGKIDVVKGEGEEQCGKVKMSDLAIGVTATNTTGKVRGYAYDPNDNLKIARLGSGVLDPFSRCNALPAKNENQTYQCVKGISQGGTNDIVYFYDENIQTVQGWIDFMRDNNVEFTYTLAEPTPIYCEPTEIKSLKGSNNVWADTGDVEDVQYIADTKTYIDNKVAELQALVLENIGG